MRGVCASRRRVVADVCFGIVGLSGSHMEVWNLLGIGIPCSWTRGQAEWYGKQAV